MESMESTPMTEPVITTWAYVALETRSNFQFIITRIMKREDDAKHPLNFSGGGFDAIDQSLSDLELCGHFSSIDGHFLAFDEAFYNMPFSVDLRRAKAMTRTLTKIKNTIIKNDAREPGDVFMAFCKAVGVAGTVIRVSGSPSGSHRDSIWAFTSVTTGRDQLRRLIADGKTEKIT